MPVARTSLDHLTRLIEWFQLGQPSLREGLVLYELLQTMVAAVLVLQQAQPTNVLVVVRLPARELDINFVPAICNQLRLRATEFLLVALHDEGHLLVR